MDSLNALRGRAIVRNAFLDETMSTRIKEHAEYYGTMTWVLMMLEQWFQPLAPVRRETLSIGVGESDGVR